MPDRSEARHARVALVACAVLTALCSCSQAGNVASAGPSSGLSASAAASATGRPGGAAPTSPGAGGAFPPSPSSILPPGSIPVPGSQLTGPGAVLGPVRQLPVNGVRLGYRQFGHGPELVLVTGYNATMSMWTLDLLAKLAVHFRVTIFDNRGVGYSTDDLTQPITVPLMSEDTVGLIQGLGLRQVTLLGWSMGGEIGLTVAALHPGALARLVTVGGDAGGCHIVASGPEVAQQVNAPSVTIAQTADLIFPPSAVVAKREFLAQYALVPQETVSPQTLTRQAQAEGGWSAYTGAYNALPGVRIPVLITNGTQDVVNPPGNAEVLRARMPSATVALFPGAGHGLLFQDTERFVELVAGFVG